jgi:hypothetical protein
MQPAFKDVASVAHYQRFTGHVQECWAYFGHTWPFQGFELRLVFGHTWACFEHRRSGAHRQQHLAEAIVATFDSHPEVTWVQLTTSEARASFVVACWTSW